MDTSISCLAKDIRKGQQAIRIAFHGDGNRLSEDSSEMPENKLPTGIGSGSLEHILFITLSVSIDYQRDADRLWDSARTAFEDPETTYLFNPSLLVRKGIETIVQDMQKHRLSKKPYKDAHIWRTVALSFFKKWDGDPMKFLEDCSWDANEILSRLVSEMHLEGLREASDFPFLKGKKIGPLWLRMLRDNVGLKKLRNLERVPIPVDVHVARSSLALGIVRGSYHGPLEPVYQKIRDAWAESVNGFEFRQRKMIALDMDKPLWNLSKFGCTSRTADGQNCAHSLMCPYRNLCVAGRISIANMTVDMDS